MAEYFIGQIMMTGFGFAAKGFAQCNGQILPTNQNQALFALLGTTYGGNGTTNFGLPDLRSRVPVGAGTSYDPNFQPPTYACGAKGGAETVGLTAAQNPTHTHGVTATTAAAADGVPTGFDIFATAVGATAYSPPNNLIALAPATASLSGGGTPHTNLQPFQVLNFNIALTGVFPSRG